MIDNITGLSDFVRINAPALGSSGLYQGKAGVALSLFSVARALDDERIEDEALGLLEQSLLTKTDDIGMASGLSGIGYVLATVIKNHPLDADFDDLYREQTKAVFDGVEAMLAKEHLERQDFDICLFLKTQDSEQARMLLEKLLGRASSVIESSVLDVMAHKIPTIEFIRDFSHYLRLVLRCGRPEQVLEVVEGYSQPYNQKLLMSSWDVGHSLGLLAEITGDENLREMARKNRLHSPVWFEMERTASLRLVVDRLRAMLFYEEYKTQALEWMRDKFMNTNHDDLEEWLQTTTPMGVAKIGYGNGIARLLMLLCENSEELKDQ